MNESVSKNIYHFTDLHALGEILKTNTFRMSDINDIDNHDSMDVNIQKKFGDKRYYACFTRVKDGRLGLSNYKIVRIEVDGDMINQRYSGKAVSGMWQGKSQAMKRVEDGNFGQLPTDKFFPTVENEDRIFSNKPIIPNFLKYVRRIDIYVPNEGVLNQIKKYLADLFPKGLVYIYFTKNEFKVGSDWCNLAEYVFDDMEYKEMDVPIYDPMTNESINEEVEVSDFEPKSELHPKFWTKDMVLNSRVRLQLLDIADDFLDSININWVKPKDILFTGSLANYNWTEYSDIDVHIVMDYKKIYDKPEFVKDYFDSKKEQWMNEHEELKIYGFPVEMYVEDLNAPGESSGVYSLEKNKWVKEPKEFKDDELNEDYIKNTAEKFMSKIDSISEKMKKEKDKKKSEILADKMIELFEKLKELRQKGLKSKKKELSDGNIIWKIVKHSGYVEKMWDVINASYDRNNSINEMTAYHMSNNDFKQFNTKNNSACGIGSNIYAGLTYVTTNPKIRDHYKNIYQERGTNPMEYVLNIPDGPYFDLEEPVNEPKLINWLKSNLPKYNKFNEFLTEYYEGETPNLNEFIETLCSNDGDSVLKFCYDLIGVQNFNQVLMNLGYVGLLESKRDGVYLIFDDSKIKILKKEFHKRYDDSEDW